MLIKVVKVKKHASNVCMEGCFLIVLRIIKHSLSIQGSYLQKEVF